MNRPPALLALSRLPSPFLTALVGRDGRRRRGWSALALSTALVAPLAGQQSRLKELDAYVEQAMARWGVPGAAIAIVKDDSVVYSRGFGVLRLGEPARVDGNTLFAIGSATKAFTTAALAILQAEGKLSWDDRVVTRLPGFELRDAYVSREVTLRDLVSHRTGLQPDNLLFWGSDLSRDEVVRRMRYLPQRWSLRSRWDYHNPAYVAAGQIIPAVTGLTWDDFIRRRIFEPLGMTRSLTGTRDLPQSNVASPHAPVDGRMTPIPWLELDNAAPAGSIVSTTNDMVQWIRLHLNKGSFRGRQLLSEAAVAELHAPLSFMPREPPWIWLFPEARILAYGHGWILHEYRGHKVVEHGGQTDGMHGQVAMMPEEKLGLVVLTNSVLFGFPASIGYRIFDLMLGAPPRDWSEEIRTRLQPLNTGPRNAPVRPGNPASISRAKIAGRYRNELYGDAEVTLAGERLTLRLLGQSAPMEHWNLDSYRLPWADGLRRGIMPFVTARSSPQGEVEALDFGSGRLFRRVP